MPLCTDTQEESVQAVMHHCTVVGKPGEPGTTNWVLFLQLKQTYRAAHTRDGRKTKENPFLVVQLNVSLKNEVGKMVVPTVPEEACHSSQDLCVRSLLFQTPQHLYHLPNVTLLRNTSRSKKTVSRKETLAHFNMTLHGSEQ
jgi:hypothetical protein